MKPFLRITTLICLSLFMDPFTAPSANAQEGFDNETRALFILDIAKYVQWDDSLQSHADFKIGLLNRETDLYWDLTNMAKTRKFIQQKPIKVYLFRDLDQIEKTHILFTKKEDGFELKKVLNRIGGNNTLLITEGFDFKESMLNFIVVDGKPRFEVNEKRMNREKLSVSELFLAQAVKTREDWEALFKKTEIELEKEKEVVRLQKDTIQEQNRRINDQRKIIAFQERRLDSLDAEIQSRQQTLKKTIRVLSRQEQEINKQKEQINRQMETARQQEKVLAGQQTKIDSQQTAIAGQMSRIRDQEKVLIEQLEAIEKQKMLLYFFIVLLILISGLGYFIYRAYRIKKTANIQLEEKNRKILEQKNEIEKQKEIAESQRDQIAYQKKHITDSIEYAKRIQTALLPSLELFSDQVDHFVLYKPRDIVSGDFYWVNRLDNIQIVIAADCTGHGVPGAFMSMLGVSLLNEIIINKGILKPDEILEQLREEVIISLKQREAESDVKDGMDMVVCKIDYSSDTLEFAGANNPLYLFRDGELRVIKGDKMPVAIHENMQKFKNHTLPLKEGDTIYIFSDGYVDQFGGPNQKKFLARNFRRKLEEIQQLPMIRQGARLDEVFEDWRKDVDQIDDVTVIGIRYTKMT